MENEFGDFEEIETEQKESEQKRPEAPSRIKQPKLGQFIGIILQRLGGNRMSIKSTDNKIRNCRVPGRFRRKFWLRPGDTVIIQPWPDNNDKADVIYQYKKNEKFQLEKSAMIKKLKEGF